MEANTIKSLLHQWEINNGIEQSMLTDFDSAEITELDRTDDAVMYEVKGQDNGYDYSTSVVTYGETDLFALGDWQNDYPASIKDVDSEDHNWRTWWHYSGREAVLFAGLPRVL